MSDDQLVQSFVAVTNASKYLAEQYLLRNDNDLSTAIEDYYASNGESERVPTPRSSTPKPAGGVRTLRDLNDQDEPDDRTNANFFTGGEKSALQVENPNKDGDKKGSEPSLIERIFQRAREQAEEPDDRDSAIQDHEIPDHFTGTGFKLGDSSQPLQPVGDAAAPRKPAKVNREITFWRQGFTVGDGPLQRYDDPANQVVLQELKRGRVPVSVLGVEFGQDVDVSVLKKTDEDYVPPKRKIGGFGGSGQRLGSPVPGESAAGSGAVTPDAEPVAKPQPDQGSGDSLVQIRFANGKRATHKFNSGDSVVAVYDFVRQHEHNDGRPFTLTHAFPVKPIEESEEVTVAEAKLKNAVVVQRWK